jgi:1,3-beta-glucan synthase
MKFDKIDWSKAFFKTYLEKRSFLHLLVNFNRIWVMHIAVFWIYTAWNSPSIYAQKNSTTATRPMIYSMSALGGAVACLIMIVATLAEFSYIPTTWNNTSHLARRLIFLLIILAITGAPSIFDQDSHTSLIISVVQFAIAICAVVFFAIVPSGRMFGDRVAGKNRKYLANQTFTASYPALTRSSRIASISLWVLIFGLKYVESYFFLTLSFRDPIKVMTGMKVQNCNDKVFGNALCRNQAAFALALMFVMDLCLFFLDTFLWYVIWNTVFSIGRSFALGMSVWTPWKDIFMRLPKRIYAKLLATADMEVKYKPKVRIHECWNMNKSLFTNRCAFYRFWYPKSGTPSSSRCIVNICSPSTTFRSYCTTKSLRTTTEREPSELQHSSFLKVPRARCQSSSPKAVKPNDESPSSPNH